MAFKIRTGQIIEEHLELGIKQIPPPLGQMIKERLLMFQEQIVARVELVTLGQLAKVGSQQIAHGAALKPLPVQTPLAARIDQPVSTEGLQDPVPPRAFATNRQALGPKLIQIQFVEEGVSN